MHVEDSSLLQEHRQPHPSGPLFYSMGEPQLNQPQAQPDRLCFNFLSELSISVSTGSRSFPLHKLLGRYTNQAWQSELQITVFSCPCHGLRGHILCKLWGLLSLNASLLYKTCFTSSLPLSCIPGYPSPCLFPLCQVAVMGLHSCASTWMWFPEWEAAGHSWIKVNLLDNLLVELVIFIQFWQTMFGQMFHFSVRFVHIRDIMISFVGKKFRFHVCHVFFSPAWCPFPSKYWICTQLNLIRFMRQHEKHIRMINLWVILW